MAPKTMSITWSFPNACLIKVIIDVAAHGSPSLAGCGEVFILHLVLLKVELQKRLVMYVPLKLNC